MTDIDKFLNSETVICSMDDPEALGYTSLYEKGDVWIKIRGCEDCPEESRIKCCGQCPMSSDMGCYFHLMNPSSHSQKPFGCISHPHPKFARSYCCLEFKCIRGSNEGKIRRVRDKHGVLIDGDSHN